MNRLFYFLGALLFFVAACSPALLAQTVGDPTQDPTALTNAFFKAMQDEDGTSMMRLTTDDFAITSFDGQTADKELLLQGMNGGYLVIDNATTSGLRTRTYNNDAAVVTGNSSFKGSLQGQSFDTPITFTSVCVKQGGSWKVANMQLSAAR